MKGLPAMFEPVPEENCISYWLPKIEAAGLPVPATTIVHAPPGNELIRLLDGETPDDWYPFIDSLQAAVENHGTPCFLRTGHGSGKHDWVSTCFVPDASEDTITTHVVRLVEWSFGVDLVGLPVDTWAVRTLLDTVPLFTCPGFGGFPVTREFRFFMRDGLPEHIQPYWPASAVAAGAPDDSRWRTTLDEAAGLDNQTYCTLSDLAVEANKAVPGYWSIDFLQDRLGGWWLTDMAVGERSFRYDPSEEKAS